MVADIENADLIDLHYEAIGEGAPLVWVHGFMGAGADWRFMFNEAPRGYRLVAPDLRGHGRSPADGTFSFRQSGRDILRLLDRLEVDRVSAIGISGGGIALLHAATAAPSRFDSLVLVSAPPYFPERAREIQRQSSEAMFSAEELALMRQRHPGGEPQIQRLLAISRGFADSYEDVNFTPPLLSTISARTLIVFGDRDPLYPVGLAFELHAAIPNSALWVVPNGGHAPVFGGHARAFREAALSFIDPSGTNR